MHRVCTMPPKRRFDRVGLPAEKRRRNGITTGLLHSVLAMAAAQFHSSYAAGPPNILIILADDLGYGDLGVTGHPTSRTPAIDQLAATGLRLTSFYTASPVCSPSRAGIATGRFPARSGVYCADNTYACGGPPHNGTSTDYRDCCNGVFLPGMPGGMSKTELTVAQLLQPRGYTTMMIGKWHLGIGSHPGATDFLPTSRGFDHYYGVPHGLGACPCYACFAPNASCAINCNPDWAPCPVFANSTIIQQPANLLTLSASYGAAAVDFVIAAKRRQQSWFLWYSSHHVHSPQFAGASCTNATSRGRFGDSLYQLDEEVAAIMAGLASSSQEASTLTIFTSDNGPSLRNQVRGGNAGLLRCGKGTTWEGGLRVPAIFHWPGRIEPGTVSDELATTLDLLPTFLALTEHAVTLQPDHQQHVLPKFDGMDLSRLLLHNEVSPRTTVIYYPQLAQQSRGVYAVRVGSIKVHFKQQGSMQCDLDRDEVCGPGTLYSILTTPVAYDLSLDPGENWPLDEGSDEYHAAVLKATMAKAEHENGMEWNAGGPQLAWAVGGGWDINLQPCAEPGCKPFPSCCTTPASAPTEGQIISHGEWR